MDNVVVVKTLLLFALVTVNNCGRHGDNDNNQGPSCQTVRSGSLICRRLAPTADSNLSSPGDVITNLRLVNVSGAIGSDVFAAFPDLTSLEIGRSRLDNVTFATLPHLYFLVFKGNLEVPVISSRFFTGIEHVSWLSFVSNRGLVFEEDCLVNLANLTWLHIQKQDFPRLGARFLSGAEYLDELTITWSNLSEIDPHAFDFNANLEILSLNFNKLTSLHPGTFRNLTKLRFLELHHNHFVNLELRQFADLISLEIVGFPSNILRRITAKELMEQFPNLKKVEIKRRDRTRPEIIELIRQLGENGVDILGTPHDCQFPHPPYHSCLHNELAVVPPLTTHT